MTPPPNRSRPRRQGKSGPQQQGKASGQVRIIGGSWRGRRLPVADVAGLRPTGDRVRETLFNWLQRHVPGSHCLDLFAGTGALGFEALSRQAASVTFVEPDARAGARLREAIDVLGAAERAHLQPVPAAQFLAGNEQPFDLVFVDPPFDMACQWQIVSQLLQGHLGEQALIYVESPRAMAAPVPWPVGLGVHKEKVFGEVHARLLGTDATD